MIKIDNIYKLFGNKDVLNGVSLTIEDGKTTCIIGKSGCGKSVLLKHIVGLLEPDKGNVKIDGVVVSDLTRDMLFDLRKRMGYVFQGAALFDSMTVFDNVVIREYERGIRDEKYLEDEAKRVLSAVGLLPSGNTDSDNFRREWDILKEKKPSDLSGGMKKRVGVARALVGKPDYIFYDEPTTGLDPVTSEQIDDLIKQLADTLNVTSIVITHDMFSVYRIADKVAMLDSGKVRFEGPPHALRESDDPVVLEFLKRYE